MVSWYAYCLSGLLVVLNVSLAHPSCLSYVSMFLSQLEEEKAYLQAQKHEAEQEKMTIRDELVRLEQERLELDSARLALHQSLQESELSRVGMEAELQSLRADRVKLQDKVTQVNDECPLHSEWECGKKELLSLWTNK